MESNRCVRVAKVTIAHEAVVLGTFDSRSHGSGENDADLLHGADAGQTHPRPVPPACDSIATCHGDAQHTGVHFMALAFLFSTFSKRASASWRSGYMGSASGLL